MRTDMPRRVTKAVTGSRWNGPRTRACRCGLALLALVCGPGSAAALSPGPTPSPLEAADEEACDERFEKIRQKFENEKATSSEEYLRIPTIVTFSSAPCRKTIDFLTALYETEANPGIAVAITEALVTMAKKDAIEAAVKVGLVRLVGGEQIDEFTLDRIGEMLRQPMEPEAEDWLLDRGLKISPLRRNEAMNEILLLAAAARRSEKRIAILTREIRATKSPELQATILESIAESPDKNVAKLGVAFARARHERVVTAAYDILRMTKSKTYRKYFVSGLKSPHWQVRVLSVDALSDIDDKSLVSQVAPLLKDKDKRVQVTAVHALMVRGGVAVMEPLIEALEYTKARVLDDVTDALTRLTSRDFGPVAAQWDSWWRSNRDKVTDNDLVALSASEFSALKERSEEKATLLYHGLRVLSDYVAFVIDISESMKREYTPKKTGKARSSRTEVTDGKKPDKEMRIETAKKELSQVVKGLEAGKSFNIVGFETFTVDFNTNELQGDPERLVKMEPVARAKALGFVGRMKPGGLTNVSGAIQTAFGYGDVDTVFLLSDGTPEGGGITDHEELLRAVRRWNRLSKVKINIVGFDLDEKTRFLMERLADQNFGVFVER